MSDIIFALKIIIAIIFLLCFLFFTSYFILANDHIVTVYVNPIYFNSNFYGGNPEFEMPVWKLTLIAFFTGVISMGIMLKLSTSKQQAIIDSLSKENSGLKNKFDKVKIDISKCVT